MSQHILFVTAEFAGFGFVGQVLEDAGFAVGEMDADFMH
jgi:hypothetical protein